LNGSPRAYQSRGDRRNEQRSAVEDLLHLVLRADKLETNYARRKKVDGDQRAKRIEAARRESG
jgi:hypothetical protein